MPAHAYVSRRSRRQRIASSQTARTDHSSTGAYHIRLGATIPTSSSTISISNSNTRPQLSRSSSSSKIFISSRSSFEKDASLSSSSSKTSSSKATLIPEFLSDLSPPSKLFMSSSSSKGPSKTSVRRKLLKTDLSSGYRALGKKPPSVGDGLFRAHTL